MISLIREKFKNLKNDKLLGDIFSGSILVFTAKIGATLIGLVTSIIVARYYGAEVVGIVALINSFLSIAVVFTLLGTNTSILRFIPEYKSKYSTKAAYHLYKKLRLFVIITSLALGLMLFFGSDFVSGSIFDRPDLSFLFILASCVLVFKTLQNFSLQGIRAVQQIRLFALIHLLSPAGYLVLLLIFTFFFYNKYNPVYLQFFIAIVFSIVSLLIIQLTFKREIQSDDEVADIEIKKILRISFPMFLTSSIMIFNGQMANILIGYFKTEEEVGYYSIAFKIASLTIFILQAINTTIAPKFSQLYFEKRLKDLFIVARYSTKLIFWGTMPLLLFFVFFGKWLIVQLYGADFEISYYLLLILSVGMVISALTGSVGYFLNMCGHEQIIKNVSFITLVLVFITGIILIPMYGVYGAAIATAISQSFRNITLTIIIYRKFKTTFIYIPFISK